MWDYPLVYDFNFDLENLEKPWVNCSREKREEYFNYGMYTQMRSQRKASWLAKQ